METFLVYTLITSTGLTVLFFIASIVLLFCGKSNAELRFIQFAFVGVLCMLIALVTLSAMYPDNGDGESPRWVSILPIFKGCYINVH